MKWNPYTTSSCPYSIIIYNNSHVAIVGEINEISIGETMVDLGRTLKNNQSEVVIFISSNGGNVVAGNNFIELFFYVLPNCLYLLLVILRYHVFLLMYVLTTLNN